MIKKALFTTSLIVLFIFAISATPAIAYPVEPDCDGSPFSNDYLVHDFDVATTGSGANVISGLSMSALLCGTEFGVVGQRDTFIEHVDIQTPPHVLVNESRNIDFGSYVGHITVNLVKETSDGFTRFQQSVPATLFAQITPHCKNNAERLTGGNVPGEIIACYSASAGPDYNYLSFYVWVTRSESGGRYTITISPNGYIRGFTRIHDLTLCAFAGEFGSYSCGNGSNQSKWLQKNGDATANNCQDGKGLYKIITTNKGGEQSPDPDAPGGEGARKCVVWEPSPVTRDPECDTAPNDLGLSIDGFDLTTESSEAYDVSSLNMSTLVCGTALSESVGGTGSLTDHIDILGPNGFFFYHTGEIQVGSFAGRLTGRVATHRADGTPWITQTDATITVADYEECRYEHWVMVGVPNPPGATIRSCLKVESVSGSPLTWHGWIWDIVYDSSPCTRGACKRKLILGPIRSATDAGITKIEDLSICGYVGTVGGSVCGGSSRPRLHRNGYPSYPNCENEYGFGAFTITATNKYGETTAADPPLGTCVEWRNPFQPGGRKSGKKSPPKRLAGGRKGDR